MVDLAALEVDFRPALEALARRAEALLAVDLPHPRQREHIEIIIKDAHKMLSLFDDPAAYRDHLREKYHEERDFDQPTIAHELRSPAGRIASFVALLLDCPDVYDNIELSDAQRQNLTLIGDTVRQMLAHAIFRRG